MKIALAAALAPILIYGALAFLLGAIPANRDWREPVEGVTIFVETNGVHSGLLVPVSAAGIDWRGLIKPAHLKDPRYAGTHLWIGWGERRFYLETPHWQDVRPSTVAGAVFGSNETLMHVDHVIDPRPSDTSRPLRLTPDQYRRLTTRIRAQFADDARPIAGYGPADVFYAARGRYDAIETCNTWTGRVLREAGIRVGLWTPFSATVMWWF